MPSFLNADGTFLPTQSYTIAPATGATVRANSGRTFVQQAGTLAALTILMPSNPKVNQVVEIIPGATITALTLQTASGGAIAGAPTAGVANTRIPLTWTGAAWVRLL